MDLALVVLAAGMGSRYGGLKQLEPVGPSGELILDYSLFDARRAGFNRVVFIIRPEIESAFRSRFGKDVTCVHQLSDREKPWGTGHAVWSARSAITGPFAVINADDFYGAGAFKVLAAFLASTSRSLIPAPQSPGFAFVGYRLDRTLSEFGKVSRGICEVDGGGTLRKIVERKAIAPADVGPGKPLAGTETVSMNCWGFTPAIFPMLDSGFREFVSTNASNPTAEYYLPEAVSTMITQGHASVEVLPTDDDWFGITYREDLPRVKTALASLVASGKYPAEL